MTARYDLEILPVSLGLHMAHTGSADPLPAEDKARHVAWLRQRLAEWQPSHAKWERFDEAVKAIIMATLDEVDPMPLDVLTPDEQDLVIASIPLQTGLTRDGERVIAAAKPRRCVAVLATDAEDRVLLVLSSKPGRGWELPGGGVNRGESAVDAAYREVLEETGIAIVSIEARRGIPGTPKPGAQYPSTIYVMTASGAGKPKHGSDAINAWWFYKWEVLNMHSRGLLSDLASREDLLSWANDGAK